MKKISLISLVALILVVATVICSIPLKSSADVQLTFTTETKNGRIYGIPAGTTPQVVGLAHRNTIVEFYDKNNNPVDYYSATKVGTGFTVKLGHVGYIAIVMGDLDGDGELKVADYMLAKRAYMGEDILSELGRAALGVGVDDPIRAINYLMIKRAYMGTYDLNGKYTCDPYNPIESDETGWTTDWV